jgi:thiol:disulfide interchange protein
MWPASDPNLVGLVLIGAALAGFGLRLAARGRPDRRTWSAIGALVIVGILIGLVALLGVTLLSLDEPGRID